jgi:dTDP-4-amino-4,6-dideoxygalactose transaminase
MDREPKAFRKSFTRQEPISETAIARATEVLRSGKLHRYNVDPDETSEVSMLEVEFAAYMGMHYCLACASCGSAIYLALKSAGVQPGDTILCNAFTLAPVPGMIENAAARIILVEICSDYTIDLHDLEEKARRYYPKWLLLSHMRGHIADMDKVVSICREHGVALIEDCAHTMGARWDGQKSGSFGLVSCFSSQTYKHMNSGEGGLLVTNDEQVIARAILYSGSYMLYDKHTSRPNLEVFAPYTELTPNYSCRMDNLRAAILRPQLIELDAQCRRWNERYRALERHLKGIPCIECPPRDPREDFVGSSIQFNLVGFDEGRIRKFLAETERRGVYIKWFGRAEPSGFTSSYHNWRYLDAKGTLPQTDRILSTLCDMRIPLTFELEDCEIVSEIIADVATDCCD